MTFPTVYNPKRRGSRPKYGNKKVTVQGIKFDSKWESQRYLYLKSLERADQVKDLELQVRYNIEINGEKICTYVADFRYQKQNKDGEWYEVVEYAKGVKKRGAPAPPAILLFGPIAIDAAFATS